MRSLILTLPLLVSPMAAEGETKPPSPTEEYQALVRQWNQAIKDYAQAEQAARTPEAKNEVLATFPKPVFQDRFMQLARKYPNEPATVDPLVWVLVNPWHGPQAEKNYAEALEILTRDFLDDEKLADACGVLGGPINATVSAGGLHPGAERLLRTALERSRSRRVRGTACFSLAWYLRSHSGWRSGGMSRLAADAMAAESERYFEQVVGQFADVEGGGPYTLGRLAEAALFETRNLVVDKVAPEITGEDLEGRPLRLSDYRGKVVLLTFWASWCGPCMAMVPHERSLAERLEGRPFAILGFNGDNDRATARRVVQREQMTWSSWWDRGRDGTIIRRWNVLEWPTTYILDSRGVIRHKNPRISEIDAAVDALLDEAKGE